MIHSPEDLARLATFDQLDDDSDAQQQWYALSSADRASLLAEFDFTRRRLARKSNKLPWDET